MHCEIKVKLYSKTKQENKSIMCLIRRQTNLSLEPLINSCYLLLFSKTGVSLLFLLDLGHENQGMCSHSGGTYKHSS